MSKLKNFFNFFGKKKEDKKKEDNGRYLNHIHDLISNNCELRVSYKNIHSDEESCSLDDFQKNKAPRCTGNTDDILRVYIYNNRMKVDGDYYFVRRYDNQIRL